MPTASPPQNAARPMLRNRSPWIAINAFWKGPRKAPVSSQGVPQQEAKAGVIIFVPGGLEAGGGIGRQMGYFFKEQENQRPSLTYTIVDTRGRRFINGSFLHAIPAIFYLASSVAQLAHARFSRGARLAHINITGRGSTMRKLVVAMAAHSMGMRYLLHVHDYNYSEDYNRRSALMKTLVRQLFRGAAKILVLGSSERHTLSMLLGLAPDKIAVLHNAVPEPQSTKLAQPNDECRIVFLGTLSERKGVPELISALGSPALRGRRWRATLAGDGRVEEFRRLALELGIAERIDFPGWVNQTTSSAFCAGADVLVLPSHAEGLAMSVLEGLSHGLAVITTPVGAHGEVIEPEISGLFVPPGNIEALSAALARVIDDPSLRAQLRAGARSCFLEKFHVRDYAEKLGKIHASLI